MRETKITVTIYPTSKQSFGSQGIYGDYVLVTSRGEYTNRAFIYFSTALQKNRTSPAMNKSYWRICIFQFC